MCPKVIFGEEGLVTNILPKPNDSNSNDPIKRLRVYIISTVKNSLLYSQKSFYVCLLNILFIFGISYFNSRSKLFSN